MCKPTAAPPALPGPLKRKRPALSLRLQYGAGPLLQYPTSPHPRIHRAAGTPSCGTMAPAHIEAHVMQSKLALMRSSLVKSLLSEGRVTHEH